MKLALALVALAAGCNRDALGPLSGDGGPPMLDGSGGGASDGGSDLATNCPPPSTPATRAIDILARNDGASDRFVVIRSCDNDLGCSQSFMDRAGDCTPYGISDANGPIDLHLRALVVCEGPAPPSPTAGGYHRIHPGESFLVGRWSGSRMLTCDSLVDCSTRGWPGVGVVTITNGYERAAPPGDYRITIAVENALPPSCQSGGPTDYVCDPSFGFQGSATMVLCPSTATASATFTLAATGDATVVVPIP